MTLTPTVARLNGLENVPGVAAAGAENNRPSIAVNNAEGHHNLMTRDVVLVGKSLKDVKGSPNDWSARAVLHEIGDYLSVVKPPVLDLKFNANNAGAIRITINPLVVTDNGDGVVYNGSGDKKVINEVGLCWALGSDPTYADAENKISYTIKSDLEAVSRKNINFSSMACLSHYYNTDGSRNEAVEVAATDSVVHVRAYAVSKWAEDGTLATDGKTPMIGYSTVHRYNWVTGLKMKDDE